MSAAVAPVVDAPTRPGFGRLARDSAIYASGSVAGKAIGLLLLPVVTRVLGPEDFGRFDVLSTFQSAATSILLLGLDTGATRLHPDLDRDGRRSMFGAWLQITLWLVGPLTLTLALFRAPASELLFGTDAYADAVGLTALAVLGATVQLLGLTVLRNQGRAPAYAAVSAGTLAVNGVGVAVLLAGGGGLTAVLGAMAGSMVIGGVAALAVAGSRSFGRPDPLLRRRLLVLGLPLLPAMAATWVAEFANRAILLHAAGPAEVGYFSVAARFASVALLVVVGFQTAWQPKAFADGPDDPEALQRVARDGLRIMAAVASAVVALALISPELVRVAAGDEYLEALPAIGLSLVFALGLAAYHVVTMPSALSRRMRDLGLSAAAAAGVGIALNLWWAPAGGSSGTAAAVAVGQFTGVGVGVALARSQAAVPYRWPVLAAVVGIATALALAVTLWEGGAPLGLRAGTAAALVLLAIGPARRVFAGRP